MQINITHFKQVLLLTGFFATSLLAQEALPSLPLAKRDDQWRNMELGRAKSLLSKHDFSPINEAFEAKDILLLWHYYTHSNSIKMHRYDGFQWSEEALKRLAEKDPGRAAGARITRDKFLLAGKYLKQIPGHARFLGDSIESMLRGHEGRGISINTAFSCLSSLAKEGSDECIEQLSRYLYDKRDPTYMPDDPLHPKSRPADYIVYGQMNPMQNEAAGGLFYALKDKVPFVKSLEGLKTPIYLVAPPLPGYADKLRAWWPTAPEVAVYRRSLVATGVVLPPGYPQIEEIKGSSCTIAPPLKNPPYPDRDPDAPPLKPVTHH